MAEDKIRLIQPSVSFQQVEADFKEVFETGIFTRGKHVQSFMEEMAAFVGAKHCHFTTSATTALWTCLKLLGIKQGDEVAISDFSFPATANVVEDIGARPVFVDVMEDTFNMCVDDLKSKITPKTRAVIFVDALGNPSGLHDVKKVCQAVGLPLIEDAACAIGSSEFGAKCGSIADLTCFSFHPRKLLCTGEGGAITTSNDEWGNWLRVKLLHGASVGANGVMDFVEFGYNFRLTELQAVMGRSQLETLPGMVVERQHIFKKYVEGLETAGFMPQKVNKNAYHNVQSIVFRVPQSIGRDELIKFLAEEGIESTIGTYCQSGTSYYADKYHSVQPRSKTLQSTTITLPCYPGLPTDVIIEKILAFCRFR